MMMNEAKRCSVLCPAQWHRSIIGSERQEFCHVLFRKILVAVSQFHRHVKLFLMQVLFMAKTIALAKSLNDLEIPVPAL